MRKVLSTSLPASLFLAFLAIVLFTFAGCGGDDGGGIAAGGGGGDVGGSAATLTGLSIHGPSSMSANRTATYTATASWSDNSTSAVSPTWGVNSSVASISPGGVLSCSNPDIVYDEPATVTAAYSSGGITQTATKDVTITGGDDGGPIPPPPVSLSGALFVARDFHGVILARVEGSTITIQRIQADPYCHAVYSATGIVGGDGTFTLDFHLDLGSGTAGYSAAGQVDASGDHLTITVGGAPPVMLYATSSGMAGSYQGSYFSSGSGQSGLFAIGIDGNGNVVGFDGNDSAGWFFFYAMLSGNTFSASAFGGPVFSGSVSGDAVTGTWTNSSDGQSGTFAGARAF